MRQCFSLNPGWRFRREENITDARREDMFSMFTNDTKTGAADGPRGDGFYDGDWETVTLPHDWCVGAEFDEKGGQGCKPKGRAWYRRCFAVPGEWDGKRIFVRFDGIAIHSTVWLNGIEIASSQSGYTPISREITSLVRYGDGNVLSVCASNEIQEGWWYEGGGIYRDVWLTVTEETRLSEDGVFLFSRRNDDGTWTLSCREETDGNPEGLTVSVECLGKCMTVPAEAVTSLTLELEHPPLWSPDDPKLVPVTVKLLREHEVVDSVEIPFGFRTVQFSPEKGCFVNGQHLKLRGCCMHHDHAGVGTAVTYPIHRYRLQKLREMGCNAIRTSHNPQSPDFYRACDEMGFLVMDETRHFSATREVLEQLRLFVRRDRNHPCVIFWSLFNEEPLQCSPVGEKIARAMKAVILAEDGTRPVSGGMNGALEPEGAVKVVDMMGFNYLQYGYEDFHRLHPDMPLYGSENSSWRTCRGESENRMAEGHRSGWHRVRPENLHPWSASPGETWKNAQPDYVAGVFEWTGMDYRGEATLPAVVSDFGALDLCGFPKDSFWWHKALWLGTPQLKLCGKWEGVPGEKLPLRVYTNADSVAISVNGRVVETIKNDVYDPPVWHLPYEAGCVTARGITDGRIVCEDTLCTPGAAARLVLTGNTVLTGTDDVLLLDAALEDAGGNVLPDGDADVTFSVTGGHSLGVGNGDNASRESDTASHRHLFHGLCQAVIAPERAGTLTVRAECGDIHAEFTAQVGEASGIPALPPASCRMGIAPWRMSDVKPGYPEKWEICHQGINWIPTTVGCGKSHMLSGKRGFASVTGKVSIPQAASEGVLTVVLERIVGIFDLYLGEKQIFSAESRVDREFRIPLDGAVPGTEATLALVFRLDGGDCGVYGGAYLELCEKGKSETC